MEVENQITLSEPKSVIVALENGNKFDVQEARTKPFEYRIMVIIAIILGLDITCVLLLFFHAFNYSFQLCISLCQLLVQLSTTSFGPIRLANISQDQFVITNNGHLKLHHILSLEYEEPSCSSADNCSINGVQYACSPLGKCSGYNTKSNIYFFTENFFIPLLSDDVPGKVNEEVAGLLSLLKGNKEELPMIQGTFNTIQSKLAITTPPTASKHSDDEKTVKGIVLMDGLHKQNDY